MSYKVLDLRAKTPDSAATEIMYEIAACRADGIDLTKINICYAADGENKTEDRKIMSSAIKLLKNMKQKGSIRLFATKESFENLKTEAVYLINKYPFVASEISEEDGYEFIFVKI